MADYKVFSGVVAFEPDEVEISGRAARRVTITLSNSVEDTRVSATLWEEMSSVEVKRGDFVLFEGSYKANESGGKIYHNVNVARIAVLPSVSATKSEGGGSKPRPKSKVQF